MNYEGSLHYSWQAPQSHHFCGSLVVVPSSHKMPCDSIICIFWGVCNYIACSYHPKVPRTLSQYDSFVVHVHYLVIDSTSSFGHRYHLDKRMRFRARQSLSTNF